MNPLEESIEFVQQYLDEVSDFKVYEIRGDRLAEVDPTDELNKIRDNYLRIGLSEGYVDSEEEFDDICDYLR